MYVCFNFPACRHVSLDLDHFGIKPNLCYTLKSLCPQPHKIILRDILTTEKFHTYVKKNLPMI